jgi:hypothetical protein
MGVPDRQPQDTNQALAVFRRSVAYDAVVSGPPVGQESSYTRETVWR